MAMGGDYVNRRYGITIVGLHRTQDSLAGLSV